MRGITRFRAGSTGFKIDLRILSAGYGLVDGMRELSSYDSSFAGLRKSEIERRADELNIPGDVARTLAKPSALALLLLGDDYMRAAGIDGHVAFGGPAIAFGGTQLAQRFEGVETLKVVAAGKNQARQFSCGLVGLKGELAGRLLEHLAVRPDLIHMVSRPEFDVLDLLDLTSQQPLGLVA